MRHGLDGVHVELFHGVKIDWLGKKWYFLGFSLIFSIAGVLSILFWHHIPLGIDFKGGTIITVSFAETPDVDRIRSADDKAGVHDAVIQAARWGALNEVYVSLPQRDLSESALGAGRDAII